MHLCTDLCIDLMCISLLCDAASEEAHLAVLMGAFPLLSSSALTSWMSFSHSSSSSPSSYSPDAAMLDTAETLRAWLWASPASRVVAAGAATVVVRRPLLDDAPAAVPAGMYDVASGAGEALAIRWAEDA
jgi:hypothetical protein